METLSHGRKVRNACKDTVGEFGRFICRLNGNVKLVLAELRCHIKMILKEVLYEAWAPVGGASQTYAFPPPPDFWVKLRLKGNV
jgi:hypothetical protein